MRPILGNLTNPNRRLLRQTNDITNFLLRVHTYKRVTSSNVNRQLQQRQRRRNEIIRRASLLPRYGNDKVKNNLFVIVLPLNTINSRRFVNLLPLYNRRCKLRHTIHDTTSLFRHAVMMRPLQGRYQNDKRYASARRRRYGRAGRQTVNLFRGGPPFFVLGQDAHHVTLPSTLFWRGSYQVSVSELGQQGGVTRNNR